MTDPTTLDYARGVDAGTYTVSEPHTVSEPLTVEVVRERIAEYVAADGDVRNVDRLDLYRDVLRVVATDRGPVGDLARAALTAEGVWYRRASLGGVK